MILKKIQLEFTHGQHRCDIKDLPLVVQSRLGCTWDLALDEANKIVKISILMNVIDSICKAINELDAPIIDEAKR